MFIKLKDFKYIPMKTVFALRSCFLLMILLPIISCVSDSTTENKSESASATVSTTNDAISTTKPMAAKPQQGIAESQTTATEIPAKKPKANKPKPKANSNPINPKAKKKVVDQARKQLSELEANKSSMSVSDFNRKKESYEAMISNPEKFIPKSKPTPQQMNTLPSACGLISEDFIGSTIGVDVGSINMKDGTSSASEHARACFFRWDHKGVANSGVLIQIQENPLPDEIDDWAAYYIQAKINQGETNPNTMESTRFKPYKELGISGAYNYEMQRYLWRTDNDKVFMIAFNLRASEKEQLSWAKTLGEEIMKNYRP